MILVRRHATLIEIIIAMALTAIMLTTLTFFYRQISHIGHDIDQVKAEHFQLRYVENRLADILPKAIYEKDRKKDFVFFSFGDEGGFSMPGSQSLIFTFDNGVNLDKPFSAHVIGRLYLDRNGRLVLAYWPSPRQWDNGVTPPMKKEILLEGVTKLSFEFFIPPDKGEIKSTPKQSESSADQAKNTQSPKQEPTAVEPEPKGDWRRQPWMMEYQRLPAMIKVNISLKEKGRQEEKPMTFIFPLINTSKHIIYE